MIYRNEQKAPRKALNSSQDLPKSLLKIYSRRLGPGRRGLRLEGASLCSPEQDRSIFLILESHKSLRVADECFHFPKWDTIFYLTVLRTCRGFCELPCSGAMKSPFCPTETGRDNLFRPCTRPVLYSPLFRFSVLSHLLTDVFFYITQCIQAVIFP